MARAFLLPGNCKKGVVTAFYVSSTSKKLDAVWLRPKLLQAD